MAQKRRRTLSRSIDPALVAAQREVREAFTEYGLAVKFFADKIWELYHWKTVLSQWDHQPSLSELKAAIADYKGKLAYTEKASLRSTEEIGRSYVEESLRATGLHFSRQGNGNLYFIRRGGPRSGALRLQVRSAKDACERQHFGKVCGEWRLNRAISVEQAQDFWYALVDVPSRRRGSPTAFIVPSSWIAGFLSLQMTDPAIRAAYPVDRNDAWYYLVQGLWADCKERWDRIEAFLRTDSDILKWCSNCPDEARDWKGGGRWGRVS